MVVEIVIMIIFAASIYCLLYIRHIHHAFFQKGFEVVYNKSQAVRVEEKLHIHTSAEKNYSKFNTAVSGFTEINSFVLSITL